MALLSPSVGSVRAAVAPAPLKVRHADGEAGRAGPIIGAAPAAGASVSGAGLVAPVWGAIPTAAGVLIHVTDRAAPWQNVHIHLTVENLERLLSAAKGGAQ